MRATVGLMSPYPRFLGIKCYCLSHDGSTNRRTPSGTRIATNVILQFLQGIDYFGTSPETDECGFGGSLANRWAP